MRLHRLEVRAFGPFADEVVVDLDALGSDGLFLLHGDTGAGKTTLLDAVAFALYGRVPGARNEAKRLRCDRAAPTTRTQVRLEATIAGHRLELTRNPEYQRAKARGIGYTVERARVVLRWIGAAPSGRSEQGLTRADEVGEVVGDLLGMSADQFFQVVLLPQGDFARFLRADTAERGVLLERLFDTGRFGTIEEWFALARRDAGNRLREADAEVDRFVARVAEAARVEMPHQPGPSWIADLRDRLADLADRAAERAAVSRHGADELSAELRRVQARQERVQRLRDVRGRLAALDERAPQIARFRAQIERHRRTPRITAAHTALVAARRDHLLRREAHARAVDALGGLAAPDAVSAPGEGAAPTDALSADLSLGTPTRARECAAADRDLAGALAEFDAHAAEHDRDRAALAAARRRHHQAEVDAVDVEQRLAGLPALINDLAERVNRARSARDRLPPATAAVTAAEQVLLAAEALPALLTQQRDALAQAIAAVDGHQRAVDDRQSLIERRIAGIAGELASGLAAAAPCPVCGSAEHPRLAAPADNAVTAAHVRAAQQAERAAAVEREHARAERALVDAAVTAATGQAAGHDVGAAREGLRRAKKAYMAMAAEARTVDEMLGRQDSASKALFEHSLHRDELAQAVAGAKAEIATIRPRVEERGIRLRAALAGHQSLAFRRAHLLARATAWDAVAAAGESADVASAAEVLRQRELVAEVEAAGFVDLDDAMAAASVDIERLNREVRGAEDARTAVEGQLRDPALAGIDPDEHWDVSGLRAGADEAARLAEDARSRADAAADRRDQVGRACRRLVTAWHERAPIAAADAEISVLADVIHGRGQNALGMSLRTYVLAARLRQVADAAGQRLERMSAGRYGFVHSTDRESRGKAGGLGLDIFDAWSGLVRPAKTLSGGESFLASLALALGLADVVASEAGGRVLDTLFVDEGFGGLDADTLDLVMGTLDELRAGGRVVGVVSHVAELQQRIPSRLCVRRTSLGSTIEMHSG
ncbi:MAG TPA: SMC family ATPase [Nakamurella sp.]|nr:SMC family ATPase [Nakamurella sp.]